MGWAVGFDQNWNRDIGYGVPAICDHPDCDRKIDRGLAYVCGGEPYGGDLGCGLFFCAEHLAYYEVPDSPEEITPQLCDRCADDKPPYEPKPDLQIWIDHKNTDPSWEQWRKEQEAMASTPHLL